MSGGDLRISLQPGFGGLMHDLGRHPVGDAAKKAATPAPEPPLSAQTAGTDTNRFLPAVLTLSSPVAVQGSAADRRELSLAEFQQAFVDFGETGEPRQSASPAMAKPQDAAHARREETRPAPPSAQDPPWVPPRLPNPDLLPQPLAASPRRSTAAASPAASRRPAAAGRPSRGGAAPDPASGQPTLFMFGIVAAALFGGWLALRVF